MKLLYTIFCGMLSCVAGFSQDSTVVASNFPPPATAPVVYAVETQETIIIDGRLNEPVWSRAPVIKDFFRMEPRQGGVYKYM
jgi:hypothetical protein